MEQLYDVIVVGAGPAGLSAALNAAIRNGKVLVIGPSASEKLNRAPRLDNVLGNPNVTGVSLLERYRKQVSQFSNVSFLEQNVQFIYPMGDHIGFLMPNHEIIEARTAVVATGVNFGNPIPGEQEFLGKGVGTCATCDAALYRGKPVIVVGYNEMAAEEANFISEMASQTTFINMTGRNVDLSEGILELKERPKRVIGDRVAEGLELETQTISADGIFFIRDAKKADALIPGLKMIGPHIATDTSMATSVEGIYAAGDLVGQPYQVDTAIGRGQIAGLSAAKEAARKRIEEEKGKR
ncbi:MAG: NAD(P)/FAD-dependent oxidoreductase [Peptoniphilaceae bacterium]|nr:NAD(P)/FAD-dependent oxidoreductase [Peptoniphilaceae bacterium]MDY3987661.1 NAD(P)/FAD-dependent oxidoreductase [Peptoniphilaceae bacterium]MDY6146478.1 NAD(P)/FAD-dependent oxidoreductase [Peptoniphilaceae bacterium]